MRYIYGSFSGKQIKEAARAMHNDIHKLLLYKDPQVEQMIFEDDKAFFHFFKKVMYRFSGTVTLFNNNGYMVSLMSVLQGAYNEVLSSNYDFNVFRTAILDAHSYIKIMFEGGDPIAEFERCKKSNKHKNKLCENYWSDL